MGNVGEVGRWEGPGRGKGAWIWSFACLGAEACDLGCDGLLRGGFDLASDRVSLRLKARPERWPTASQSDRVRNALFSTLWMEVEPGLGPDPIGSRGNQG